MEAAGASGWQRSEFPGPGQRPPPTWRVESFQSENTFGGRLSPRAQGISDATEAQGGGDSNVLAHVTSLPRLLARAEPNAARKLAGLSSC
jgi:hypothetical protein